MSMSKTSSSFLSGGRGETTYSVTYKADLVLQIDLFPLDQVLPIHFDNCSCTVVGVPVWPSGKTLGW